MDRLSGSIRLIGGIDGGIRGSVPVDGKVEIGRTIPLPWYEGEYELTPVWENVTLETKQKSMREDVTMQAIPYAEVDNLAGGKTAIIGG